MAAKRKCMICGQYIEDADGGVPYKNRYVHHICFESTLRVTKTAKDKQLREKQQNHKKSTTAVVKDATLKKSVSEEEFADKKKVCEFLKQLTGADISIKAYSVMDKYKEKFNLTYKGIYQALVYFYDIKGNPLKADNDGIGIVPYIYEEANRFFESTSKTQAVNVENSNDITNMYQKRVVRIKPPVKTNTNLIDIGEI